MQTCSNEKRSDTLRKQQNRLFTGAPARTPLGELIDAPTDLLVGWGRLLESPGKPVGMFCMKSVIHD